MRSFIPFVLAVALSATACTNDPDPDPDPDLDGGTKAAPQVVWHACDQAVEATFLSKHRCGTLTVPQDRRDPDRGTLDLPVLQTWPVGVEPEPGLGTSFGANLGDPANFTGGAAMGATRLRHVGVQLGMRGTVPSAPDLTCPELDALSGQAAAGPDADPGLRSAFLEGARQCASRLRAAGIEPANFDAAAAAADVDDLLSAMGADSWWMGGSYGTQSRVLFRYLHDFPGRLDGAYLDSPWFPGTDDLTGGVLGARSALLELFAACAEDARCASRYPDLEAAWERALLRTARTPLQGVGRNIDRDRVRVLVDDAKLLRFARYSVGGDGSANLRWLPRVITNAASGRLDNHLADLVASDPLFCAGYRPLCIQPAPFAWGVLFTSLCHDQLPGLDEVALRSAVDGDPAYEQVFARSPYRGACEEWATPGQASPPPPDPDGTPLLLIPGQFDSFARPEWSQQHASAWDTAWVFTAPNNTHNTLGFDECGLGVRNAWVRTSTTPPDPGKCAARPELEFK